MAVRLPNILGAAVSVGFFLLVSLGLWFYYCYYKPRNKTPRQTENPPVSPKVGTMQKQCGNHLRFNEEMFYSNFDFPHKPLSFHGTASFGCFRPSDAFHTLDFPFTAITRNEEARLQSVCQTKQVGKHAEMTEMKTRGDNADQWKRNHSKKNLHVSSSSMRHHCVTIEECEEESWVLELLKLSVLMLGARLCFMYLHPAAQLF